LVEIVVGILTGDTFFFVPAEPRSECKIVLTFI